MMNVKKRQAQEAPVSLECEEASSSRSTVLEKRKANHGVADGVGGWARKGIDAGDYAPKGSSTASIVSLQKNVLHGVNVGDSGLMLFRNNTMLFQSPIQQRKFNTPFQLGNAVRSDRPDFAVEYQVHVESHGMF
ncbi:probable protein phosphatase 2C 80 [Gastrolobium bilobum]|uniref:probable protein phosphatase 2C 80 n=1 Tax=Gastrolobium bilobum TaxID=150636 RepID=UPI002AB2A5E4|nr:probable protein phosphatase 2C 80 [Gastrolobium bilobum]